MPHIVVVFGERFWTGAHSTFKQTDGLGFEVISHEGVAEEPYRHFVNRYEILVGGRQQSLLLVRLDHPSARGERHDASWWLKQDVLRKLVELG